MTRASFWLASIAVSIALFGCEDRLPAYRRDSGPPPRFDAGPEEDGGRPPGRDAAPPDGGPFEPGIELRCTALGDACTCSEPLDTNGWGIVEEEWLDPVDSPTATECRGHRTSVRGAVWYPRAALTTETASGFPAGSPIEEVWTNQARSGESYLFGSWPSRETSQRLCVRVYQRFSGGYQATGEGACTASGLMALAFREDSDMGLPASTVRVYEDAGGFRMEALDFGGMASQPIAATGALSHDDCTGGWCRTELCVSGDLENGTGISVDAVVAAPGGAQMTWSAALGDAARGRVRTVRIADMTREGDCGGTRSLTHAMQAEWETDTGQRIGPAVEVEGG